MAMTAASCTPNGHGAGPTFASATGVVIAVTGPNSADVDSFTLRTADGQVIEFTVGRLELIGGGLPAPHLREHLVSGVPITVDYSVENGQNLAIRYVDAAQ
jgi:hypothetical protein